MILLTVLLGNESNAGIEVPRMPQTSGGGAASISRYVQQAMREQGIKDVQDIAIK